MDKGIFDLRIEMGNEAMMHPEDVSDALIRLASKIRNGFSAGCIYDLNGNIVGDFKFSADKFEVRL